MSKKLPPVPAKGSINFRKTLSAPYLLKKIRGIFKHVPEHRKGKIAYPLADVLMSGLAMFGLKSESMLAFDQGRADPHLTHNLQHLYDVEKVPCDTQMRTVLDQVDPKALRPATVEIIHELQKQGVLESYRFLGGYLVSADGTGMFSSSKISCSHCCEKQHKNGETTYHHQLLASVIVHPDQSTVLPLFHEPITKQDGKTKNDCEHNASKRLVPALKKGFPRLNKIMLQDALACNGPHINLLKENDFSFIITAKPTVTSLLLKSVLKGQSDGSGKTVEFEVKDETTGIIKGYRYANSVPLNSTHKKLLVNFIDYWEVHPNGKEYMYACVTDLPIAADNVEKIVRAGRSCWKVENETFNTLKNQGYCLEHNYGHGKKHLATTLALLMMLAFTVDQVQELCCSVFKAARHRFTSRKMLWRKMRGLFDSHFIKDWYALYAALIWGFEGTVLETQYDDTS
jgi:hypothetical protein